MGGQSELRYDAPLRQSQDSRVAQNFHDAAIEELTGKHHPVAKIRLTADVVKGVAGD